jgi:hypothetical protein
VESRFASRTAKVSKKPSGLDDGVVQDVEVPDLFNAVDGDGRMTREEFELLAGMDHSTFEGEAETLAYALLVASQARPEGPPDLQQALPFAQRKVLEFVQRVMLEVELSTPDLRPSVLEEAQRTVEQCLWTGRKAWSPEFQAQLRGLAGLGTLPEGAAPYGIDWIVLRLGAQQSGAWPITLDDLLSRLRAVEAQLDPSGRAALKLISKAAQGQTLQVGDIEAFWPAAGQQQWEDSLWQLRRLLLEQLSPEAAALFLRLAGWPPDATAQADVQYTGD